MLSRLQTAQKTKSDPAYRARSCWASSKAPASRKGRSWWRHLHIADITSTGLVTALTSGPIFAAGPQSLPNLLLPRSGKHEQQSKDQPHQIQQCDKQHDNQIAFGVECENWEREERQAEEQQHVESYHAVLTDQID